MVRKAEKRYERNGRKFKRLLFDKPRRRNYNSAWNVTVPVLVSSFFFAFFLASPRLRPNECFAPKSRRNIKTAQTLNVVFVVAVDAVWIGDAGRQTDARNNNKHEKDG